MRYDRIVSFGPYQDGFGIMRDAQTAKPHTFVIGDDWFAHNLVLSQPYNDSCQDPNRRVLKC